MAPVCRSTADGRPSEALQRLGGQILTGAHPRRICLALQGGGSHGAFEWGALDALLEDGRLSPAAASGASAGAMNAVVMADGLSKGGHEGARRQLDRFWREISLAGPHSPFGQLDPTAAGSFWRKSLDGALGGANPFSAANPFMAAAQSMAESLAAGPGVGLSPYQLNPFNLNPLRDVLDAVVDFEQLRAHSAIQLFIAATQVRSGRLSIFREQSLTCRHIMASACLPQLFQAVEIDGEAYWDGGYLADPPLWPLFYGDLPRDVLVINLNPFRRANTPHDSVEIIDRLNEIGFNATLISEFRAAAFVNRLVEEDLLNDKGRARYKPVRLHMITSDGYLADLPLTSKFNTDLGFLTELKARGREAARTWLDQHLSAVGRHSSVDVRADFL